MNQNLNEYITISFDLFNLFTAVRSWFQACVLIVFVSGKVTLFCLHIFHGNWNACRSKSGPVVYLLSDINDYYKQRLSLYVASVEFG